MQPPLDRSVANQRGTSAISERRPRAVGSEQKLKRPPPPPPDPMDHKSCQQPDGPDGIALFLRNLSPFGAHQLPSAIRATLETEAPRNAGLLIVNGLRTHATQDRRGRNARCTCLLWHKPAGWRRAERSASPGYFRHQLVPLCKDHQYWRQSSRSRHCRSSSWAYPPIDSAATRSHLLFE